MVLDNWSLHNIAESIALGSTLGGALFWVIRRVRKIHIQVTNIWLFLTGDAEHESLIDRMIKEEFRSRFMMMHAKDGIFECDEMGACTYVNPTMAKMYGLEASQMLGNGWLGALQPNERSRVWDNWLKAVKDQTPYEATHTLKNGRRMQVVVHTCFGADRGKPLYYIGVTWDAQSKLDALTHAEVI